MELGKRNGQVWSIDVVVAAVIFLVVLGLFYQSLSSTQQDEEQARLAQNADTILTKFEEDTFNIIVDGNVLNRSSLNNLTNASYEELKSQLSVRGDFCLYLKDDNDKIVPIGNGSQRKRSIGHPAINVSGRNCSSTV